MLTFLVNELVQTNQVSTHLFRHMSMYSICAFRLHKFQASVMLLCIFIDYSVITEANVLWYKHQSKSIQSRFMHC